MELIGKIGIGILWFGVVLLFTGMFIPRQLLLKVKLESIPDSIKSPGDGYVSIFNFPSWMLNDKGRWLVIVTCGSLILGFFMMGLPMAYDFIFN